MSFQIKPRDRGYDSLFNKMVESVPEGTFYDFTRPIVMWNRKPSSFILETDNPSYPVRITRERLGDFDIGVDTGTLIEETTVVPQPGSIQTLFSITLGRGRNLLTAREILPNGGGRSKVLEVVATTNTLIFESYGREIYRSISKAQSQKEALLSKYSTRLLDQISGIGDVLPDLQTLKILSTKMLIRSFIHFPATKRGVEDMIEAVTLNTPIFHESRDRSNYQIETSRIMRTLENQAGQEAHIWFPNLSVTRWLAFIKMADTFRNNFELIEVKDNLVQVMYKGKLHIHKFDYDAFGQNFLTNLSLNDCFKNFEVGADVSFLMNMLFLCWTYPLDSLITEETSIGRTRSSLDVNIPFDSSVPFDADPTDPWNDGFVGWSYSGRFDDLKARPLDSTVAPSRTYTGPLFSYEGPYIQLLNSMSLETPLEVLITASGDMDNYTVGPVAGLGLDFNNTIFGVETKTSLMAGVPALLCVKYVDVNQMTNMSGTGVVRILEPICAVEEFAPISAGFVYIYFTPTVAVSSTTFELSDGTYTDSSEPFKILPNVFSKIAVTLIPDQVAGAPFTVSIQCKDAWDNNVTDIGFDNIIHVQPVGGLDAADPTPNIGYVVAGQSTITLTCLTPGEGQLKFKIGAIEVLSETFKVS